MTSPGVRSSEAVPALTLEATPAQTVSSPEGGTTLLERLAQALEDEGIRYCQWKGHWSAHRWSRGLGDVDLLIEHDAIVRFRAIAGQLGFKLAYPAGERQIPGLEHYFGFDPLVHRLLHLHVHYQLLIGEYWRRVYHLPIERQILAETVPGQPFRVPSPTHSFLIFVFRLMLRQVGRPLLSIRVQWLSGIRVPLASLEAESNAEELQRLLEHLSPIDLRLFERCVRSLDGQSSLLDRVVLPWLLHLRLRSEVRRPPVSSMLTAVLEKVLPSGMSRHIVDYRMRLSGGGQVVALIGGDGAGKSTCARELHSWLAPDFPTMRAHLGNPPRSLLTLFSGTALKLEGIARKWWSRSPQTASYLELFRHVCTARDRYRLYQRARRFAVSGGIAVCERYPLRPNFLHVAPAIPDLLPGKSGRLAEQLRRAEAAYYERILAPDAVFVLKLDPELAVVRKPEEPADYVRARGRMVWDTDWSTSGAHVVDASRPLPEVLRQLKTNIWSIL